MKYTQDGFIRTIKTRKISYFGYTNNILSSRSFKFELKFLTDGEIPTIGGLTVENWFTLMFEHKIITSPDNNSEEMKAKFESIIKDYDDPFVFVESRDKGYLLKLLFNIISQLSVDDSKLISIKLI